MAVCIGVKDLTFSHQGVHGAAFPALQKVGFSLAQGEYLALLGENGSGKSTLVACMNGILRPPKDAVSVYAGDGTALDPAEESSLEKIRANIGIVMQNPDAQIIGSTVEDDAAFGPENMGLTADAARQAALYALTAVGIAPLRARDPNTLSGGEKQRLALAGVLAVGANILIFDEPTAQLDPSNAAAILALFDTLHAQGKTLIHITHSLDEALRAQRALVLQHGAVVFDGAPSRLPFHPELAAWGLGEKNVCLRFPKNTPSTSEMQRNAVVFQSVCYGYKTGTPALRTISLTIPPASATAFIGKSGCGKTTLLKQINALLLPEQGSVLVNGVYTADKRVPLRALRFRVTLGVQSPESALFETYTADDVAFGAKNAGLKGKNLFERVKTAMESAALPFAEFADRPTYALSGGEKRRAALAGVLAMDGEIVVLDEPLASLDNKNKNLVMEIIRSEKEKGKTVIITTHSIETAANFDYVGVMSEGRLEAFGPPAQVFGEQWQAAWGIPLPEGFLPLAPDFSSKRFDGTGLEKNPPLLKKQRRRSKPSFTSNFLGTPLEPPSPWEKIAPFKKLVAFFGALAVSGMGGLIGGAAVFFALIFCGAVFGKIPPARPLKAVCAALPFMALLVIFQLLFFKVEGTVLLLTITDAQVLRIAAMVFRFGAVITAFSVYSAVTQARETLRALKTLLSPLARFGLPAKDIAMIINIAVRFIPVLIEEAERISAAQLARGRKTGFFGSASIIIPLMVRALDKAQMLADALLLRLYKSCGD